MIRLASARARIAYCGENREWAKLIVLAINTMVAQFTQHSAKLEFHPRGFRTVHVVQG